MTRTGRVGQSAWARALPAKGTAAIPAKTLRRVNFPDIVCSPGVYVFCRSLAPFPRRRTRPIFHYMAKDSNKPPKKPKDPARPTRAKASRPDAPATPEALADLLNPAINKGTAGLSSGTGKNSGLQPPPD